MKTISIANLKGGVGKTVTAINLAYLLAAEHGKKVLLVDNDQQGNSSQFFGVYDYEKPSMSDIMELRTRAAKVIQHTGTPNLDIIPANLSLAEAEKRVLVDVSRPQQGRLQKVLGEVMDEYDYCIIDNAPSLGMCTINALVASDYIIIPAKIDKFTFDGVDSLLKQAQSVKEYYNARLSLLGTLITSYRRNEVSRQGAQWLQQAEKYKAFDTCIRWTDKMDESTFTSEPVMVHSPRSGAARDYRTWVNELLELLEGRN